MLKKITLVMGNTIDSTCLHIQRKADEGGNVRTLCGRNIAFSKLRPVKEHCYDRVNVLKMITHRALQSALLSNCYQCLRLETGLPYRLLSVIQPKVKV